MKILLDLQACQSAARHHGIGRYTLSLTKEMIHQAPQHDFWILLNANLPESIDDIKQAFKNVLADERIILFHLPFPTAEEKNNPFNTRSAELIREYFIEALQPDIIHINSLFDGWKDNVAVSIGTLSNNVCVSVTLYDLIPLVYESEYLPIKELKAFYNRKLDSLKKANLLLAISDYSKQEAQDYLEINENKIVNIKGSTDAVFQPQSSTTEQKQAFYQKYSIDQHYILCAPSSFDPRKNLNGLLQAYAQLPKSLKNKYKLVLIGRCKPQTSMQLQNLAAKLHIDKQLVLTGYVSEGDLLSFYQNCSLFVFPSRHEGFGLPPLEAMACGAVTISSSTTSLAEVVGNPAAMFNPVNTTEMTGKIQQALTDNKFRQQTLEHAEQQVKKFTWQQCAKTALAAMEKVVTQYPSTPQAYKGFHQSQTYYKKLIDQVRQHAAQYKPKKEQLIATANAIAQNEKILSQVLRRGELSEKIKWRMEGPFDSSYSLALVNREIALAMHKQGYQIELHSTEGTGDFEPNTQFLNSHSSLNRLYQLGKQHTSIDVEVSSRNLYPPRVSDMGGSRINLLHNYAWEETEFPKSWVEQFNDHLQGIVCVSKHVQKILVDNGVNIPIRISGNGVDHWERIKSDNNYKIKKQGFTFLHVSSCFPRKGVDILLQSYGEAFTESDKVQLIIKTFPNPHNKVRELLKEQQKIHANYPKVKIIEGDLTEEKLKALYQQADVMVCPSRAEGFGLPMAEAMLSGLAVITTNWGGVLDFCTQENSWLLDYDFAYAESHFELFDSLWAEPKTEHLTHTLKQVFQCSAEERQAKATAGRQKLLNQFKWSHVAQRLVAGVRQITTISSNTSPKVGWVSSWNTKCGIANYSQNLVGNMGIPIDIILAEKSQQLIAKDSRNVKRCWDLSNDNLEQLSQEVEQNALEMLVIQFNYGFFNFSAFQKFIDNQINKGRTIILELHSTTDPKNAPEKSLALLYDTLKKCHRILVHSLKDINQLKALGLVENVTLFPLGILESKPKKQKKITTSDKFVIASYGFFLPQKGLLTLIDVFKQLKEKYHNLHLLMLNSEYPAPVSVELIQQAKAKIKQQGLESDVTLITEFLSDEQCQGYLQQANLLVFPYQYTGESSSSSVRYSLSLSKPTVVTPNPIFQDIEEIVFTLSGSTTEQISEGLDELIEKLKNNDEVMQARLEKLEQWRQQHTYQQTGKKLSGILSALQLHCLS